MSIYTARTIQEYESVSSLLRFLQPRPFSTEGEVKLRPKNFICGHLSSSSLKTILLLNQSVNRNCELRALLIGRGFLGSSRNRRISQDRSRFLRAGTVHYRIAPTPAATVRQVETWASGEHHQFLQRVRLPIASQKISQKRIEQYTFTDDLRSKILRFIEIQAFERKSATNTLAIHSTVPVTCHFKLTASPLYQ